jgi:site-specific DNA-methyltransferase (adenine-specific)
MIKPYYQDDFATIYHGDCLDVMPQLSPASAQMVLSDPPYCSGGLHRSARMQSVSDKYSQNGKNPHGEWIGDQRDQRGFAAWYRAVLATARTILEPQAYVFNFIDWRQLPLMTDVYQAAGIVWRGIVVWDKGDGTRAPHKGYCRHSAEYLPWGTVGDCKPRSDYGPAPGIIRTNAVHCSKKLHQVQKPVEAMIPIIQLIAAGETLIDMFAGVGSSGVAAKMVGRKSIMIEAGESNCELAANRLREVKNG